MGPEPPVQKSSKPVVTTAGAGFFRHLCISGAGSAELSRFERDYSAAFRPWMLISMLRLSC
jgi:hypothetical protein